MVRLTTDSTSLSVILTFDNSCQLKPRGEYTIQTDTVAILLWHVPKLPIPVMCAGFYNVVACRATIGHLVGEWYTVRVTFKEKMLWSRPVTPVVRVPMESRAR